MSCDCSQGMATLWKRQGAFRKESRRWRDMERKENARLRRCISQAGVDALLG